MDRHDQKGASGLVKSEEDPCSCLLESCDLAGVYSRRVAGCKRRSSVLSPTPRMIRPTPILTDTIGPISEPQTTISKTLDWKLTKIHLRASKFIRLTNPTFAKLLFEWHYSHHRRPQDSSRWALLHSRALQARPRRKCRPK